MSLTKKDLSKQIASNINISYLDSQELVNSLLEIIKNESNNKIIKVKNFGTFLYKKTPQRYGRNPKSKKSYLIKSRKKLTFIPSNKIKNTLNWYNALKQFIWLWNTLNY